MSVQNVGSTANSAYTEATTTAAKAQETKTTSSKKTLSETDAATISKLWQQTEAATQSLRDLVSTMLGNTKEGQGYWAVRANAGQYNVPVDAATQAKAKEMISEDGFFGVKQTTSRIMDFAKALGGAGADEATIEKLQAAVEKGFQSVYKLFGGKDKMPEITKQTYDSIMQEFADWKKSVSGGTSEDSDA